VNDDRKTPLNFARADPSALDWARETGIGDEVMRRTETRVRRRRRRYATFAGSAAALILIGLVSTNLRQPLSSVVASRQPSAVVSRPIQRVLPDGSIVELKSDADIAVDFSGPDRRVELKRSEAHFQVAKDLSRPFIVMAGGVEVRAVGTAFSVDLGRQAVEVFVTEGRVSVVSPPSSPATAETLTALAFVDAGNRALVSVAPADALTALKVSPVSETELSERLSWRVPRLEFVGTPLSEAIPMLNEYSARWHGSRIVLGDSNLGHVQLSGILRADNPNTLLRVLATEFGIEAERQAGGVIVLRKN